MIRNITKKEYWNSVHGAAPGQANEDAEGLQTMRTLAKNMKEVDWYFKILIGFFVSKMESLDNIDTR